MKRQEKEKGELKKEGVIVMNLLPFTIPWAKVGDYVWDLACIIVFTYIVFLIVRLVLTQFFKRTRFIEEKKAQTIESVFKNTSNYIVFFIIVFAALEPFIDIKNLLVAGGVLGIVIGFGAQSAIKDILYGFFFLFEGQFKKGDFVHINGSLDGGTVEELGFRAVKIRLLNGKLMTVSNGEIKEVVNGNIGKRRVFESVIVSFREDPTRVQMLLQEVCDELNEKHRDYLLKDKETEEFVEAYRVYGLSSLDASPLGYRFSIAATTTDSDYLSAVQEAKMTLAKKFHEESVKMPEQSVFYQTRANVK